MKRIKKIIGIMLIAVFIFMVNAYAANDSYKTTLKVDNSQVKRGQNVKVTISLSDIAIESGEKGIGAYTANIDFDSSIFEYVSTSGTDKWEAPLYQDKLIVGNTDDGEVVKTAQDIGTITLKVKDDAKLGETTIKLTKFSASTAESDVSTSDSVVKLNILDKDSSSESGNTSGDTPGSGTTGGGTTGGSSTEGSTTEGGNTNTSDGTTGSGSTSGSTSGGGSTNGGSTGNESIGSGVLGGAGTSGSNNSQKTESTNSNTNQKDVKQGVLPQTGDKNMIITTLIEMCTLVTICIFIKIKLINRKIKKSLNN